MPTKVYSGINAELKHGLEVMWLMVEAFELNTLMLNKVIPVLFIYTEPLLNAQIINFDLVVMIFYKKLILYQTVKNYL